MNILKKSILILICFLFSGFWNVLVFTTSGFTAKSTHYCCCGEGNQNVCACTGDCCNHSESVSIGVVFSQCRHDNGHTEIPFSPPEFLLTVPSRNTLFHRILDYIEYPDRFIPLEFLKPIDKPPENIPC